MTQIRLNLRNVATIVACLAVTTMFASCDKTNPDDGNGKDRVLTNEEQKLVGVWSTYYQGFSYYYNFRNDGTFSLIMHTVSTIGYQRDVFNLIHGSWSLSNGNLKMTKRIRTEWDYDPPKNLKELVWQNVGDATMRIEIHESEDPSKYNESTPGYWDDENWRNRFHNTRRHFIDVEKPGFDPDMDTYPDYIDDYFKIRP